MSRTFVLANRIDRAIEICDERGIRPYSQNTTLLGNESRWRMEGMRITKEDRLIVDMTGLRSEILSSLDRNLIKSGRPDLAELLRQDAPNVIVMMAG